MDHRIRRPDLMLLALSILVSVGPPALARWANDPALNLAIADRPADQVLPKVALTSDGGCYVGWFDDAFGSYRVYLQRLDRWGNELWPHNGILVSDHAQSTSLVDWDLDADAIDHAVLVFTDTRDGADLDVYAYRISPAGDFEWGPDGLTLSANADYEPSPQCAALPDGNTVFIWPWIPDVGTGAILVQKVSPAGALLYDPPVAIAGLPNERPAFCDVVAADDGGFVAGWVRDIRTFQSPRHIKAQKFAAGGTSIWGPISVYDAYSVPIGYFPHLLPDGEGGAISCWHASTGSFFNSFVQHLAADGTEMFGHNGVAVSTQAGFHHLDPTAAYRAGSHEIFVFWNERNSNQDRWGIYAQKFSPAGVRMWTDAGQTLMPVNTIWKGLPRSGIVADGAVVLFFYEPTGSSLQDQILAMRLDGSGAFVWGNPPLVVSSVLSDKGRLPIQVRPDGMTIGMWEDDRGGSVDVYGQNVNADGTLGMSAAALDESRPALEAGCAPGRPNPFAAWTQISVPAGPRGAAGGRILICDGAGRVVRHLQRGTGQTSVRWDGLDDRGGLLANGVYLVRGATDDATGGSGKVTLLRP